MARRNPNRNNFQLGKPAAQTFRAQNVPHIPAPSVSGAGSNAFALASALGSFGASLGSLKGLAQHDDRLAQEAANRLEATATLDPQDRAEMAAVDGFDAVNLTMHDSDKVKNEVIPILRTQAEKDITDNNAAGWVVEAGFEQDSGINGEDKPIYRPMTLDDLEEMRQRDNARVMKQFGYKDRPELAKIREMVVDENNRLYQARFEALKTYRKAELDSNTGAVIKNSVSDMVAETSDPKTIYANAKRIAKEMAAPSRDDPRFLNKAILEGLDKLADDPNQAEKVVEILQGSPDVGIGKYLEHPSYRSQATSIYKKSQDSIAFATSTLEAQAKTREIHNGLAEGKNIFELDIKDVEYQGGTKKFKRTAKEIKENVAQQREQALLTIGPKGRELTEDEQYVLLARGFARTGLPSPTLKNLLTDVSIGPTMQPNEMNRLVSQLRAYDALMTNDPLNMKDYIESKDQSLLRKLHAMVDFGYDPQMAVNKILDRQQNPQGGLKGTFRSKITEWQGKAKGLTPQEKADTIEMLDLIYSGDRDMTENDVPKRLNELAAPIFKQTISINGGSVRAPKGMPSELFQTEMKDFLKHISQGAGFDPNRVTLFETTGGYFLRSGGLDVRFPKGHPREFQAVFIPNSELVRFIQTKGEFEAKRARAKADDFVKQKRKERQGSTWFNSFSRWLEDPTNEAELMRQRSEGLKKYLPQ